jgi:hypothetical protein
VYLGRLKNQGIRYLRPFFETGLRDPFANVNTTIQALPTPRLTLADTYWAWVKSQGAERTNTEDFWSRSIGQCVLDVNRGTATAPIRGSVLAPNLWEPALPPQTAPVLNRTATDLAGLATEVVRIEVSGIPTEGRQVRFNVTGASKYKVYLGNRDNWNLGNTCRNQADGTANGILLNLTPNSRVIVLISNTNNTTSQSVGVSIERVARATITAPSSIYLSGNVGETVTDDTNLVIKNTGDLDSILKYKQYFLSSNEITLPPRLPIPTPLAGATARVQGIIQQPYPDPGDLIPAPEGFLSPLTSRS